ncbi:hypothetical protein BJ978_003061 [Agromyces terreus]|uniref:Uncharacterized protein n=1 Tax=Agromyces terreus TaxID=424795 RepID=A0A9X2KDK4_9MICO|nr:hypothetical protein [Agromyces terreus]MCP2372385.1 hypothetical protein [Agromyces terreus]
MPRATASRSGRRAAGRRPRPATGLVATSGRAVPAAVLAVALVSCATSTPEPTTAAARLPDGLTTSILQSRQDVVDGRLVVEIDNATGADLWFSSFDVEAPGLEPGLHFEGPRTIPAGRSVQYRVDLTPARCDGDPGPAEVTLTVVATGDDEAGAAPEAGAAATGTIEADDPYDTLPRLQNSGCLTAAVERVASFTLADRLRSTGSGVDRRAFLDIEVEPTGDGDASVDLSEVLGTTLLSAEDGLNWSTTTAHIEASDAPTTISLPVRPARCDPHAGAEDKRGTILPLVITTSEGWSGQYEVRAPASLKADLFAYFTERCGLPST